MGKMKKTLYVDVPFVGIKGGDKNRSTFLFDSFATAGETDLCIVLPPTVTAPVKPENCENLFVVNASKHRSLLLPRAIHSFNSQQISHFLTIVKKHNYDTVIFRFLSMAELALAVEDAGIETKIVIDADMLFSRIAELSWQKNRSFKNRYYGVELMKLRRYERRIFNKSWLFFFTNREERDFVMKRYVDYKNRGQYEISPNVLPENRPLRKRQKEKYILFFGTLNSAANSDALTFLFREIVPLAQTVLKDSGYRIRVVGKYALSEQRDMAKGLNNVVDFIGEVDDIEKVIASAKAVILPLRIASGTRTRILEAAMVQTAVITSAIGVEGLDFLPKQDFILAESAEEYSQEITNVIEDNDGVVKQAALSLYEKAHALYSRKNVANEMAKKIDMFNQNRRHILLLLNRFYPEVGGAETNLYYQANMMVRSYRLSIFTPLRTNDAQNDAVNGYKINRFMDVLNRKRVRPNLAAKTLSPLMFFKILFGNYDVIQCFPSLHYNSMLALLAAKIRRIPIVLCSFDLLDYAKIIEKTGGIDPHLLDNYIPGKRRAKLFGMFDHIFAISNREISFYKRYNKNVSYSPVPVLASEYKGSAINPRKSRGVDDGDFVFLSLGRVSPIKGQDIALDAFLSVFKKIPGAKMVFVGREDYALEFTDNMKKKIVAAKAEKSVVFTGMVSREEVLGWLAFSDIHVIPVRFMNSGAVVVETWMSSTPVIQSSAVDPNLVEDDKNGWSFPSEDVEKLSRCMLTSYEKRENLTAMGEEGKQKVLQSLTYEHLIETYADIYDKVIAKKGSSL